MNYIHNQLSKSSLKSSSSSRKNLRPSEEVAKLKSEIDFLKETVTSLKLSLENKDKAIATVAREKEKIFVELKSVQRIVRNLQQQILDERDIHNKKREYFEEEIERLSKFYEKCRDTNTDVKEADMLREELKSKDEIICNICSKYLKVKSNKISLQKKLDKLEKKSQNACQSIIQLLEGNRKTLNDLFDKMIHATSIIPTSKRYLKLLSANANLHYENVQLKIQLAHKTGSYSNVNTGVLVHNSCDVNLNNTNHYALKDRTLKVCEQDNEKSYFITCSKSAYDTNVQYYQRCSRNCISPNAAKSIKRVKSDSCIHQ